MLTYQDYEKSTDKAGFILSAINEYKGSEQFRKALTATNYYARKNDEILKRMSFLERKGIKVDVKFHKLCNGFFPKLIKQWIFYSLGNGLTLDKAKKAKLGKRFDVRFLLDGVIPAAIAGVNYGFWSVDPKGGDNNQVIFFPPAGNGGLNGAFPLLDERTSNIKIFIRFWQIDAKRPMYAELFDERGITEFESKDNGAGLTEGNFKPYKQKVYQNAIETEVVDIEAYPEIPIFPLYVNELKESELTDGLKSYIDAFDFVSSDQVDQITTSEGIYWIVKNYGGEDFQDLFDKLQGKIFPAIEEANQDVSSHVVEAPFQSKQATLEFLERRIYSDFLMPNARQDGQAVTATEIKASREELDNKADILEWRACDFISRLLTLIGVQFNEDDLKFKRRTMTNDSEIVNSISVMMSDGYADDEWAVANNPLITDADQEPLLARLALETQEQADDTFPLNDNKESGQEVIENG